MWEPDPQKIASLSDRQLAYAVRQIAQSASIPEERLQNVLSDLDSLRRTLTGLDPDRARELLSQAGNDKAEALYREFLNHRR